MTARERIATAQISDNLGEVLQGIGDIDIIRACGLVAANHPIGMSLWRLKYACAEREAAVAASSLVQLVLHRWPLLEGGADAARTLVESVLAYWMFDSCPACEGRGYLTVPGTPMLSDEQCGACHGQGRLPMAETSEPATWLLDQIARLERAAAGEIMRRLRQDMEL